MKIWTQMKFKKRKRLNFRPFFFFLFLSLICFAYYYTYFLLSQFGTSCYYEVHRLNISLFIILRFIKYLLVNTS